MPLTLKQMNHANLCHGCAWVIKDTDELAKQVAHLRLGQYRHVAKILSGLEVGALSAKPKQVESAITKLTVADKKKPYHRDGWLFQAISWIAAKEGSSVIYARAPHIRLTDKGFDGLHVELNASRTEITAVVIFEDKATTNPRQTVRDSVFPEFEKLENGERFDEICHEVSALIGDHFSESDELGVDAAINEALWKDYQQYRVNVTIDKGLSSPATRAGVFKGYDSSVKGQVHRRRADTLCLNDLRDWMESFAQLVIKKIQELEDV